MQSSFADLKLASPFSDHMVLQRGKPVPVWGPADAGQDVTVKFGSQQAGAKADDKGNWRADLPSMEEFCLSRTSSWLIGSRTL